MTRNEAREILMQILYEMDASKSMDAETAERLAQERLKGMNAQRGTHLLCSIIENLDAIDSSINEKSRSWKTGKLLGDQLLAGFCEEQGKYPESVAIVVYSGETM